MQRSTWKIENSIKIKLHFIKINYINLFWHCCTIFCACIVFNNTAKSCICTCISTEFRLRSLQSNVGCTPKICAYSCLILLFSCYSCPHVHSVDRKLNECWCVCAAIIIMTWEMIMPYRDMLSVYVLQVCFARKHVCVSRKWHWSHLHTMTYMQTCVCDEGASAGHNSIDRSLVWITTKTFLHNETILGRAVWSINIFIECHEIRFCYRSVHHMCYMCSMFKQHTTQACIGLNMFLQSTRHYHWCASLKLHAENAFRFGPQATGKKTCNCPYCVV